MLGEGATTPFFHQCCILIAGVLVGAICTYFVQGRLLKKRHEKEDLYRKRMKYYANLIKGQWGPTAKIVARNITKKINEMHPPKVIRVIERDLLAAELVGIVKNTLVWSDEKAGKHVQKIAPSLIRKLQRIRAGQRRPIVAKIKDVMSKALTKLDGISGGDVPRIAQQMTDELDRAINVNEEQIARRLEQAICVSSGVSREKLKKAERIAKKMASEIVRIWKNVESIRTEELAKQLNSLGTIASSSSNRKKISQEVARYVVRQSQKVSGDYEKIVVKHFMDFIMVELVTCDKRERAIVRSMLGYLANELNIENEEKYTDILFENVACGDLVLIWQLMLTIRRELKIGKSSSFFGPVSDKEFSKAKSEWIKMVEERRKGLAHPRKLQCFLDWFKNLVNLG